MRRGGVVIVAVPGDYGKPRPAVIVQANRFNDSRLESYVIALLTSSQIGGELLRIPVEPSSANGLVLPSRIMAEKLFTVLEHRIKQQVGQLDDLTMRKLDRALGLVLGLSEE